MEGNQHLWNNHHFPWILVALVKSSSPFYYSATQVPSHFCPFLVKIVLKIIFEYQ